MWIFALKIENVPKLLFGDFGHLIHLGTKTQQHATNISWNQNLCQNLACHLSARNSQFLVPNFNTLVLIPNKLKVDVWIWSCSVSTLFGESTISKRPELIWLFPALFWLFWKISSSLGGLLGDRIHILFPHFYIDLILMTQYLEQALYVSHELGHSISLITWQKTRMFQTTFLEFLPIIGSFLPSAMDLFDRAVLIYAAEDFVIGS